MDLYQAIRLEVTTPPMKIMLLVILLGSLTLQSCRDESLIRDSNAEGEGKMNTGNADPHPYVGMWVTKDGYIRHELLPNGRYDEARGNRKSAYQGSYTIEGDHIEYVDDTGFTADGDFRDGVLYHAGMVLYREE
jgi:hypothetical protein